ncbi:MAG: XkdX family protein [Burkholderiales bacterium]|nr:XkdX family protein [Burkholderiales bacterium]
MTIAIYKKYYKMGLFDKNAIAVFTANGKLTTAEYKEITGDNYVTPNISSRISDLEIQANNAELTTGLQGEILKNKINEIDTRIETIENKI